MVGVTVRKSTVLVDFAPLAAFIPAALVVTMTPGADTMLLIRAAARGGVRAGWLTIAGIFTGVVLISTIVVSGIGVVVARQPIALEVLRIGGALYLLWLAISSIRQIVRHHRGAGAIGWSPVEGSETVQQRGWRERFGPYLTGFLTNASNPKVLLFFLAFFPQFLGQAESATAQLAMLAVIFALIGPGWLVIVLAAVSRSARLVQSERFGIVMEYISAAVFLLLALVLAIG